MSDEFSKSDIDRQILSEAHDRGKLATMGAFLRLSGPGWLQAAITLGGGSLASALFLGMLGGTSFLWTQLVAIIVGVIMLSAISYVTLTTGERPFKAMCEHINPVLGVGWLVATIMANMIFIMPQFSLCYDVFDSNLGVRLSADEQSNKWIVSGILFGAAAAMLVLSARGGWLGKLFDIFLKIMVGIVVICFFGLVIYLIVKGQVAWDVLKGYIPDFSLWGKPSGEIESLIAAMPEEDREKWTKSIVDSQQRSMISAAATAVGINMTFLLPYSMLNRGWDKPFRGLARFDLMTGMAIPYLLVTSCIVIAAGHSFHDKIDDKIMSDESQVVRESTLMPRLIGNVNTAAKKEVGAKAKWEKAVADGKTEGKDPPKFNNELLEIGAMPGGPGEADATEEQIAAREEAIKSYIQSRSKDERMQMVMAKPNTAQLAQSLEPLLGKRYSNLIFGIGVFGMGFSTIVVLMMINGFAFREMFNLPDNQWVGLVGALLAGIDGVLWIIIWEGESKPWFTVMASAFAGILLPIAYFAFLMMMNSRSLMGDEKPRGISMIIWNVLMIIGVVGAGFGAYLAIKQNLGVAQSPYMIGAAIAFGVLVLVGFSSKPRIHTESD